MVGLTHYHKSKDLTGQRFGRWIVQAFGSKNRHGQYMYACQCDCGVKREVNAASLRSGLTHSCGCLNRETLRLLDHKSPKMPGTAAAFNRLIASYRGSAKVRNLSFNLTDAEFRVLTKGNCNYCGIKPSQVRTSPGAAEVYIYNGIDRVDSAVGYELANCVTCCRVCNHMKSDMDCTSFMEHIRLIAHFTGTSPTRNSLQTSERQPMRASTDT